MASMKRAMRNEKEKICLVTPSDMAVAFQTHCNIGGSRIMQVCGRCADHGPRCAVPYSTGRSVSVLQRQLPSRVFWNPNDFSIVRR